MSELWWMTLEAKTEEAATGLVSANVRQANRHLQSLAADREMEIPEGSVSVIVTPKRLAAPDAVAIAQPHLRLCELADVRRLANDATEAIREIRAAATNLEGPSAHSVIRQRLADHRVLPTAVRERIADRPVG